MITCLRRCYKELENLAGTEEVFVSMVTHIKELSEDERIREQLQAREDYERRLIGQYNRGVREGREEIISKLALKLGISKEEAKKMLD